MECFWHLALSALSLAGLGFCVWVPLFRRDRVEGVHFTDAGIIILAGALVAYLHALFVWNWNDALPYLTILALMGWAAFALTFTQKKKTFRQSLRRMRPLSVSLFFLVSGVYLIKIATDPIWDFDARSIWFFAAKIIYFAHGLHGSDAWNIPNAYFYHQDYPKFVPVLAAHAANAAGFWNEYLPKLSLFVLIVPAITFIYEFRNRASSAIILLLAFLGIPGSFLWTGYMDGFLGMYAGLGVLFWLHAEKTKSLRHTAVSLLSLAVVCSLKAEGHFFAAIFFAVAVLWNYRLGLRKSLFRHAPILLTFIPVVIWAIVRAKLEVPGDDFLTGMFERLFARIHSGEIWNPIIHWLLFNTGIYETLFLVALGFVYARFRGVRLRELPWFPLVVGLGYAVFITFVYLVTPFELGPHVYSSIARISLPIVMMGFSAMVLALRNNSQPDGETRK